MMDWPVIIKQKVCPVKKTSETHTHAEDQPVLTLQETHLPQREKEETALDGAPEIILSLTLHDQVLLSSGPASPL